MSFYRKNGIFWVFLGILALQTGCQQKTKVTVEPAVEPVAEKAGPKIEFENLVYDFGKVGPGQKMNGQFKFTNTGDEPLKITKVEKCCGAVTKLDKEELAPGESGVLDVQYTSGAYAGTMSRNLYINSNDAAMPRAQLTIKAETVLKVTYEPRSMKLLLKDENITCPKITIKSTDNQPFSITSFASTGNCLKAEFDSSVKATQFVLEPKVDMSKLRKSRAGRISISLEYPQSDVKHETINIIFQALTRFTVQPSMLLVLYNNAEPVKKSLWINNNYGEDFEVESASPKEGHIKIISQTKSVRGYQFILEVTPPQEQETKQFSDTFTITLKGGETFQIPCRGSYRAPTQTPKPTGQ